MLNGTMHNKESHRHVVYFFIASLYLVSALTILLLRISGKPETASPNNPISEIKGGLQYVWQYPLLTGLIFLSIIPFLFGMAISSLMPAFNQKVLGGGPDDLGLLLVTFGLLFMVLYPQLRRLDKVPSAR